MPRPHGSPEQLEQRRLKAWKLLGEGLAPVEVARRLGVNRRSVRRWRAMGERQKLAARPASGRPPKLTEVQRERLVGHLLDGPLACGYATELWTCPRIVEVIRRRFKVRYHASHVFRLPPLLLAGEDAAVDRLLTRWPEQQAHVPRLEVELRKSSR
jgi:transposase